jgi:poly(A) polymerase
MERLVVRLAAILHGIGKPRTRTALPGGKVAFHHHEVVGAKIARKRLTALRFSNNVIKDVSELKSLNLRISIGSQGRGAGDGPFPHPPFNPYVRFSRIRLTDDLLDMVTLPSGTGWCRGAGAGRAR